ERAGSPQVAALARALDNGGHQLGQLRQPAQTANQQLGTALRLLDRMLPTSKVDPQYRDLYTAVATAKAAVSGRNPTNNKPVQDGYDGLDSALAQASQQSGRAASAVRQLGGELGKLENGLAQLQSGAAKAGEGTGRLKG